MHIDRALFHVDVATPDAIEKLVPGIDALRVSHEEFEHPVFRRTERDRAVTDHDAVAGLIQGQAVEFDHLVDTIDGGATQYRVDAGEKLAGGERLGDVVVRAAFEAGHLITLLRSGREHDHRELARFAVALQRARQLEATHVRKHPVDEHEVGALVGQCSPGRPAVFGFADFKSGALQTEGDHLAYRTLVFDD